MVQPADPLRLRVEVLAGATDGNAEPRLLLAFHRFGRSESLHPALPLSAHEPNDVGMLALPPPEAYLELPVELGGPCRFALAYVVVLEGRQGPVRAWCPRVRLLHLLEPFPVARFRAATASRRPPDLTTEVLDALLGDLEKLPQGLSVAEVWRPSRSLLGMRPLAADTVASPQALPWPPTQF